MKPLAITALVLILAVTLWKSHRGTALPVKRQQIEQTRP